jgi:hypothetical protein
LRGLEGYPAPTEFVERIVEALLPRLYQGAMPTAFGGRLVVLLSN